MNEQDRYISNYWKAVKHVSLQPATKCFTIVPFALYPLEVNGEEIWMCNQRNMDAITEFKTFPKRGVVWIQLEENQDAYAFKFKGRKPTLSQLTSLSKTNPHEILYRMILDPVGRPITEKDSMEI